MRRLSILVLLIGITRLAAAVQPAVAAPASAPPSGWVKAEVVGGGCDAQGHCSSDVTPGSPTLYEHRPDRQPVGRDFDVNADRSQHGGYPTFVDRDICHIGSVNYYWSAGIWHHGGYWTLTYDRRGREQWSGPTRQHWAFEHDDFCQPLPTPIPTATPPPPPPGAPTYTPVPIVPTEPPPSPCEGSAGRFDERSNMRINVPNVPPAEYAWDTPMNANGDPIWQLYPLNMNNIPPYNLPAARVQPGVPLTFSYDFPSMERVSLDKLAYSLDHNGQARIAFGLRDLTTGRNLIAVDTADIKELKDINGEVIIWGRTLQIQSAAIAPGVTFNGPMQFSGFDRLHGGGWTPREPRPRMNRFVAPDLKIGFVTFIPQAGHTYVVWSWNGHGACRVEAPRWTVAQFTATDRPPETFTPIPTASPSPTPTNTPTPTPPPPPIPNATFKVSIHSTLDPNNNDGDPRNGVYTSDGNTISWPAGEVLDFTPRVQITLSPPAPVYNGYRFQAHVQDWSYVSSLGQNAATTPDGMGRAGCRGSATMTSGSAGPVCSYTYIGGTSINDTTEPTEAQMAGQAHVYWTVGAPQSMRPDVYVYDLSQLQQADLKVEVRIVVEVVNVSTGNIVASSTQVATGTFGVSLIVPRSVK